MGLPVESAVVDNTPSGKTSKVMEILKDNAYRYLQVAYQSAKYIALNLAPIRYRPDAIIAGFAVYHTQKEGHAASDEVLKYRSMGTIFLAHQKGGRRTFRCTLKVHGTARFRVLGEFQRLQKRGLQKDVEIGDHFTENQITKSTTEFAPPTTNVKLRYMQDYNSIGKEQIALHKTFPIITETKIYTSMYLETLRYTEDVKLGREVYVIDLAFREFIPPTHVQYYTGDKKKKRGYFATWLSDEERDAMRRIDLTINALWATRSVLSEWANPDLQDKERGKYGMEAGVLAAGLIMEKMNIWSV